MNQIQNKTIPLTIDEINSLQGDDLQNALDQKLQEYKNEVSEIDASLKDVCDEVENMPEEDEQKVDDEDDKSIAEIEEKLDSDLVNAVIDLATDDDVMREV